jgi:hypothetical protein
MFVYVNDSSRDSCNRWHGWLSRNCGQSRFYCSIEIVGTVMVRTVGKEGTFLTIRMDGCFSTRGVLF